MTLIVHTDGGSRGNPGPAASAFIITDPSGLLIKQSGSYLGVTTNNQAEYQAVLKALTWIIQNRNFYSPEKIEFFLDSELVARQLSGQYRIKSKQLIPYAVDVKKLESLLKVPIHYISIPRSQNRDADRLVNQVLDARIK